MVRVVVVKFKRNPAVLWKALYANELLASCRDALDAAGHQHRIGGGRLGPTVFVSPEHYTPALAKLIATGVTVVFPDGQRAEFSELTGRFMIIQDDMMEAFLATVRSIPQCSKLQVRHPSLSAPIVVGEEEEED